MYKVTVTAPSGWVNFDIELKGGEKFQGAHVRVVEQGDITYFPPTFLVIEEDSGTLKINYGPVFNANAESTEVVLEIAYNTDKDIEAGGAPEKLQIGTVAPAQIPEFSVQDAVIFLSNTSKYINNIPVFRERPLLML